MINRVLHFITEGIWQKDPTEYRSRLVRWAVRQAKVLIYTVRGSGEHNLVITSAALTFYTLMSIVPIAAMIFGIVKGFGVESAFESYLYEQFPQNAAIIREVIGLAGNLLERTRGGVIVAAGFIILVWAVMRVFGNIEKALNTIWEVRRSRSMARKLSDYLSVVFIAPILWIISNSISVVVRRQIAEFSSSTVVDVLYALASLVVLWVMFAFIYSVLPNTRVRLRHAVSAGVIAGTSFQVFQVLYLWLQSWMTSYNAIYGSLAALPLFLIWAQISWQILLFGAELSFAYQNIGRYEQERQSLHMSYWNRLQVLVGAMLVTIRHFVDGRGPVTSEEVAGELDMPIRIVRDVLFDLDRSGLLALVQESRNEKQNFYTPARDVHTITLMDVVQSVEQRGDTQVDLSKNHTLSQVGRVLSQLRGENSGSPANVLLMDLK